MAHSVPLFTPYMPHKNLGARRAIYERELEALSNRGCFNTLVLCSDAYDTFVRCGSEEIVQRFVATGAAVLLSAQNSNQFGRQSTQLYYDQLAANESAQRFGELPQLRQQYEEYRYPNVGGILGPVKTLLPFMRAAAREAPKLGMPFISAWADQYPVSKLFAREHQRYGARLDYGTGVFYVATGKDVRVAGRATQHARRASSCIIHVPGTTQIRTGAMQTLKTLFHDVSNLSAVGACSGVKERKRAEKNHTV